jgi:hypothetical protein
MMLIGEDIRLMKGNFVQSVATREANRIKQMLKTTTLVRVLNPYTKHNDILKHDCKE